MYYRINREKIEHASDVFNLLAAMLFELDQTASDQGRLKDFLTTKEKAVCS
jgi:hypothetical protein